MPVVVDAAGAGSAAFAFVFFAVFFTGFSAAFSSSPCDDEASFSSFSSFCGSSSPLSSSDSTFFCALDRFVGRLAGLSEFLPSVALADSCFLFFPFGALAEASLLSSSSSFCD